MKDESGSCDALQLSKSQSAPAGSTKNSQLTVTFLGTGTSQGVPTIGCDCEVCHSTDPRDKRLRSSIYVETPECAWVIDTGADFRTQALRENILRLDAVVFTHSHTDHVMGFDDLRCYSYILGAIPIYASKQTMRDLQRIYPFAFDGSQNFPGKVKPVPHIIDGPFQLGETTITPLPVPHGKTTVNGYLFSRSGKKLVAYLSDCSAVPDPILEEITGVETLIIDALRRNPHPTHLRVAQALEVAAKIRPARTLFTHICHELSQASEAELPADVGIAYDGLKLHF